MRGLVFGFLAIGALAASYALASPSRTNAKGRAIAETGAPAGAPACASCHGANGVGQRGAGIPALAGMNAGYLSQQLASFASGTRKNDIMTPIASALTEQDREAVAAYFATLTPPILPASVNADQGKITEGAALANRGDWSDGIPACSSCHGVNGEGVGVTFPRLAGQTTDYLEAQLKGFRSGARHGDPMGLMSGIAAKLNDEQIAAVSAYFAAMPGVHVSAVAVAPSKTAPQSASGVFNPPPDSAIPNDQFGAMVKQGEDIFRDTQHYAREFVGNSLTCQNCHLDAGRMANSAPLWAAYVNYPAYRSKNKHVNSYAERLQGCFRYSMNGRVPPLESKTLLALEVYSYFLAKGAPVGENMKGRGYPEVGKPAKPMDYARGAKVYAQNCALCHGAAGQGQASASGAVAFPPLWGPKSFNWGAGMANIKNAVSFIKANMPLSKGMSLSDQDAWDVAMFVDSHERPQDPRFDGNVAETAQKYHNGATWMYGKTVNGVLLGAHSPPSGPH